MTDEDGTQNAKRALGQQLAIFRAGVGLSQQALAVRVNYGRSTVANVEVGRQNAPRAFWEQCDAALLANGVLLAGAGHLQALIREHRVQSAVTGTVSGGLLLRGRPDLAEWQPPDAINVGARQAAAESQGFLADWESRCLAPATVEDIAADLSQLARDYVYQPLPAIFSELVAVRNRTMLLLGERRRLGDSRTLLLMASLSCGLLAHASMDLGDRLAAAKQARVAARLAGETGHHALLAWIAGTQSLIAYCRHDADSAIEFADTGMQFKVSGSGRVRLAALQARAYASQGNLPATRAALDFATAAREATTADALDNMGGVLDYPLAKQHFYAASSAALLADARTTEQQATAAIAAYEALPPEEQSYGDLALSRVYLAQSHLLGPRKRQDPAAAGAALAGVLALPPAKRIAGLRTPLQRVQNQLTQGAVQNSGAARELNIKIDGFIDATPVIATT